MSIQTELTRITNAKASIKATIEGKGVTVPDGTLLDGMATLIESIQAGGGGNKVETFSITPAEDIRRKVLEIGNTSIITPHFCCCFTNTKLGNDESDSIHYREIMTYVGGDNHYFGNIWTDYYNGKKGAVMYEKGPSSNSYKVISYGASLSFNSTIKNGFYVEDGKLYSDTSAYSNTAYTFIAGVTYYVILVGE